MGGIRNGMGVEARTALREKFALAVKVLEFTNPCHSPEDGKFCETDGAPGWMSDSDKRIYGKLKGSVQADFLAKAVAAYKKKNGKLPPKAKGAAAAAAKPRKAAAAAAAAPAVPASAAAGLLAQRRKYIVDKKHWLMFPGEVGALLGQDVRVRNQERHWVSRDEFLALRGVGKDGTVQTALERISKHDLHGQVVERNGRYLDPFATDHVAFRLEQFDIAGEMLDKGGLARRVKDEKAFSVELKTTALASGAPRQKNRIYLLDQKISLNVVVTGSGEVTAALVEFTDGSFADMGKVRRTLVSGGRTLTNTIIPITDFR